MSEEKAQQSTHENVAYARSPINGERMTPPTAAEEKAVLRKLDWHILPLLFLVYTFSNLDRSNLGNARLAGLPQSVNLEGKRYDWLGTAFYISYICSQWTAVGFKRFPPHIWVFCAAIGFSTISACQAAVTNYPSLVALRVLLGCFEGMFSGVPLYLSFFYPKEKVGFRQGIFLSGSALANAYGGVLGYAILGIRGPVAPWRCLFLIEGLPVWIVAVLVWLYLPDDLISARFLTDREKEVAWQCVARGQTVDSQGVGGVSWVEWRSAFFDWRSYVPGLMYFSCNVCFGSLPLFVPTIISEMGDFDHQASNGLSAPPYGLCFVMILLCAFASDRAKVRGPFVAAAATVSTVGYCLLGVSSAVAARYIGVFLSVQIFVSISILLPWVSSVHRTESKRAGGWAIFATLGQFGPLVGTNIFPKDQGPDYHKGAWISSRSDRTAVGASSSAALPPLEEDSSCPSVHSDPSSALSEMLYLRAVDRSRADILRFFNHYSKLLPAILNDNDRNPEPYFKESPLLFWTIIATGARHLEHATKIYRLAAQEIRGGIFQPLLHITNPIPIIKASLILCLWPLPVDTMWKDPSHVYAGTAHSLAIQNGLFVQGHEQDFARTHTWLSKDMRDSRVHLWLNCCLVFQATSLCDGLPYSAVTDYKLARLEEIVEAPFHYRIKCHEILIDAIRAFSNIINEEGQGGKSLLPLIKIFSAQVEALPLPPRNDLSTEVLDVVSRLDATQDFAFYASNCYARMALLAAFCILRIVRSPLREQIDLRDAEQSIFKAISFVKRRSIQHGDLDERYGTILSQLWSNSSNSLNMAAPNDGLDLKIRSRLFMSVVFDSLWWWRVEYNGQGSPYDTDKTGPEAVQVDLEDGSTCWNSTAAPASDSFGSINFPEVYMDWNFPMNIDYVG
ncbi:hypothetical protein FSPOR_4125 [Fusarium sporotrichioides]|uniref:Major facilitator superfamily (MFS) profile domain-containing protein n=1 Tax=Fusarium sporotrichioides TaxID=5514 RepID=A0A395SD79_FUSSP|nr:hypothetical protein FSPOR_4125 [Fusarium sporotrichioides]